jgi:hypothetical protein
MLCIQYVSEQSIMFCDGENCILVYSASDYRDRVDKFHQGFLQVGHRTTFSATAIEIRCVFPQII